MGEELHITKVLILAYDFPPFVSVGGLRPFAWSRYLSRYDVEPVVVTRQWANAYGDERDYVAPSATDRVEVEEAACGSVVRTPFAPNLSHRILLSGGPERLRWLRKAVTGWYEVAQYHAPVGPKVPLYHAARRLLASDPVDVILATGEPFVLFHYAAELSREFGIPWIADYRDPWSQNKQRGFVMRLWNARVERRVVASASLVTAASESVGRILRRMHPDKRIEILPNGFDPEAVAPARAVPQGSETLTIAYTGSTYPWHPLESVFRVFQDFVRSHPDAPFALHMIGVGGQDSMEELLRTRFRDLSGHVTFTPRLPNHEMALKIAEANAFLMFNNYAYTGTKVFDYLGVGRRILLCYSDDAEARALKEKHYNIDVEPGADEHVLERVVEETESGVVVRDAEHLGRALDEMLAEFVETGRVACSPVGVDRYSRAAQTERLAEFLREVAR